MSGRFGSECRSASISVRLLRTLYSPKPTRHRKHSLPMKTLTKLALLVSTALAIAAPAHANLIDMGNFLVSSPLGDPGAEATYIGADTFLFKQDTGSSQNGVVDGSHFTISGVGNTSATISWDLTGTGYQVNYVLLKDGSTGGPNGQQIYHLYGVTADQVLVGGGMVDMGGSYTAKQISHISFFGNDPPGVPDGGTTLMMLGMALSGLGAIARRCKK